jgi:hypothetical protein
VSRPRAAATAYRIVAHPYNGWLYGSQWWSDEEWRKQEQRRAQWRAYRASLASPADAAGAEK